MSAFNPFEPEPGQSNAPQFLQRIFHGLMMLILYVIVFTASGALVFLYLLRWMPADVSTTMAVGQFLAGGAIGIAAFHWFVMQRPK